MSADFPKNLESLLRAEVAAARIEAACAASPGLGNLWRNEAAAVEAVRSVGMEDVKVSETDLLRRIADDLTTDVDARGAEVAGNILRVLRAPRDFFSDPHASIRRIEATTGNAEWFPDEGEIRFESGAITEEEARDIAKAGQGPTPLIAAMRGAAYYGVLTDRRNPVAERLVFTAIESARRATRVRRGLGERDDDLALLSGRINADWVCMPASALTRFGFRIWSPASLSGITELLARLADSLEAEIGSFARLRHWADRAAAHAAGLHGKSRFQDLIDLLQRRPVLTSSMVTDDLGVTRRTALNLIAEAEGLDLLRLITARQRYRIWATPMMAERMRITGLRNTSAYAPPAAGKPRALEQPGEMHPLTPEERRAAREDAMERMDQAMTEFDAILGQADAILARMDLSRKSGAQKGSLENDL